MTALIPIIWFIVITTAIVLAVPRILDAFLYYFDKRNNSFNELVELERQRLEIQKEQYKLQQLQAQRRQVK